MQHSIAPRDPQHEQDHVADHVLNAGVMSADVSPRAMRLRCADPLRANRVEGCLLLVSQRSIEVIHRDAHGLHRLQHGVEPFANSCEPRRWRQPILCRVWHDALSMSAAWAAAL